MGYYIIMKYCAFCKKAIDLGRSIGRRDLCPFCNADLHCCMNCRFYERSAPKQCAEPVAESVKEKMKSNFCGYFEFAENPVDGAANAAAEQAHKALGDLFK
jgi:hypothetical protein